jgi:hypothetical protein
MKDIITVSYYAHDQPKIELPDSVRKNVQVQFIDLMEQEFLFLEHAGLKVYRTFKDETCGEVQDWAECCFATQRWTDWESDIVFDDSQLLPIPNEMLPHYQAEYPDSELKQKLAYAIDQGYITESGYEQPSAERDGAGA